MRENKSVFLSNEGTQIYIITGSFAVPSMQGFVICILSRMASSLTQGQDFVSSFFRVYFLLSHLYLHFVKSVLILLFISCFVLFLPSQIRVFFSLQTRVPSLYPLFKGSERWLFITFCPRSLILAFKMSRTVEELNKQLEDMEDEEPIIIIQVEEDIDHKTSLCLIGKLWTNTSFNAFGLLKTIRKVWKPTKGMTAKEIGTNLFSFQFNHWRDMDKILAMESWHFVKHLLVLKRLDNDTQLSAIKFDSTIFQVRAYDLPMRTRSINIYSQLGNVLDGLPKQIIHLLLVYPEAFV